jgi:hypothetical protein
LTAVEERMSITTGIAPALPQTAVVAAVAASPAASVAVSAIEPAAKAHSTPSAVPVMPYPDAGRFSIALPPLETGSIARPGKLTGQLPKAIAPGSTLGSQAAALAPAALPAAAEVTASEPIAFGPALVKSAPKPFGVQLGSGPSLESIRLSWSLLAEQHGDAIGRLQPHFTATGTPAAGQTFDLVAGPIKTVADAKKICKALAARGTDCKVTASLGETF